MSCVVSAIAILNLIVLASTTSIAQPTQAGNAIKISSGLYDVRRPTPSNVRQIELAFNPPARYVRPFIGLLSTGGEDFYIFVGNSFQQKIIAHVFIDVNFAAGYYSKGRGIPLGFPIEFRSGIGLGWELMAGTQVTATLFHLSNAGFSDSNPGLESVVLSYSFLLPRFD
jgi:lipid A 3-O-deacylase